MAAGANVGYQTRTDVVFDMTSDATAAVETFSIPVTRAFRVTGVRVIAKQASAGATVDVKKGAATIASGIACAVANAVSNATTIAVASNDFAVGDTLNVVLNVPGAGARGTIIVQMDPTPFGDQVAVSAT